MVGGSKRCGRQAVRKKPKPSTTDERPFRGDTPRADTPFDFDEEIGPGLRSSMNASTDRSNPSSCCKLSRYIQFTSRLPNKRDTRLVYRIKPASFFACLHPPHTGDATSETSPCHAFSLHFQHLIFSMSSRRGKRESGDVRSLIRSRLLGTS